MTETTGAMEKRAALLTAAGAMGALKALGWLGVFGGMEYTAAPDKSQTLTGQAYRHFIPGGAKHIRKDYIKNVTQPHLKTVKGYSKQIRDLLSSGKHPEDIAKQMVLPDLSNYGKGRLLDDNTFKMLQSAREKAKASNWERPKTLINNTFNVQDTGSTGKSDGFIDKLDDVPWKPIALAGGGILTAVMISKIIKDLRDNKEEERKKKELIKSL